LIREKRFAEARQILNTMTHPKAARWLERLDEIDPAAIFAPVIQPPRVEKPRPTAPKISEKVKMPWGEPRNPGGMNIYVFFTPVIVIPLLNIYLALNWRRLGKPEWMPLSLAVSIGTAFGLWFCLLLGFMMPSRFGSTPLLMAAIFGMVVFWLGGVMSGLQTKAYKIWKKEGTAALYQHDYRVGRSMLGWLVGVVVSIGGLVALTSPQNLPHTFTVPTLSVTYENKWTPFEIKDAPLCNSSKLDNGRHCVLVLQDGRYGSTAVFILEEPKNTPKTLKEMDSAIWINMGRTESLTLQSQWETTLDGATTRVREYSFTGNDNQEWYAMLMLLYKGDKFYRVAVLAASKGIFEVDRQTIQKLYTAIHFTP